MIEKNLKLNKKDMLYFQYFNKFYIKKLLIIVTILVCLTAIGVRNNDFHTMFFIAIFGAIFTLIQPYLTVRSTLKHDSTLKKGTQITISEDKLLAKNESSSSETKWDEFYNHYITKKLYYLYLSPQKALVIPKRIFTAEENEIVENIISKNVKLKKTLLNTVLTAVFLLLFISATVYVCIS